MSPLDVRLRAIIAAARHHGVELDRAELRVEPEHIPAPATLVEWVRAAGLWARAVRLRWRDLMKADGSGPVVLLFNDGTAGLLVQADASRNIVWLKDPSSPADDAPVPVDALRLEHVWSGETILIRRLRAGSEETAPFTLGWLTRLVLLERRTLLDIFIASVTLSFLTIVPPLVVMVVINNVIVHHSYATLSMTSLIIAVALIYETFLGYGRRQMMIYIGARIDAKLNMHAFKRLLGLPLDFFERSQAGEVTYRIAQIYKIREFLTGRMLTTLLDLVTLLVLLPILFYISPTLSWLVVVAAAVIALIIVAFLPGLRTIYRKLTVAEQQKNSILIETVHGMRTVKSLALETAQLEAWDRRTAEVSDLRCRFGNLGNWPQTLSTPLEGFMTRGVLLIGALMQISDPNNGGNIGALMAFMMLSGRVASPLVSIARLMEEIEEVRTAVGLAASVLNVRPETEPGAGLRPKFSGSISFSNVVYTYPSAKSPALDGISFSVPPGTMLGLVGRSGSGKSTITRLLQGIGRDYEGHIKIDGVDLREINLAHLRRSLGVVLQENFLFRGTIKDNILAGRSGLTLTDCVRAARLAGAEEFIERLPKGFETWIEEGSPNLSGGQRQRLAIARALIHDPRILILDEATSALDPESEALVNANLQRIARGRTMLIVSHRLSSLTECDQILVIDKGTVL
ncbi:MAG: peptidase domain-containing ABC transporter, partial [Acetobacteraceae bacterium]|nr:peptidase domain-containing ABC transporter [Acetobacteraceae bacterium]